MVTRIEKVVDVALALKLSGEYPTGDLRHIAQLASMLVAECELVQLQAIQAVPPVGGKYQPVDARVMWWGGVP